jgi:hypothetical protein
MQQSFINNISYLLNAVSRPSTFWAEGKIHTLRSAKNKLGLQFPSIYLIPCKCGKAYVRQTGRTRGQMQRPSHGHRFWWEYIGDIQGIQLHQIPDDGDRDDP